MTKVHEEFIRGRLGEMAAELERRPDLKGECTLLVAGESPPEPSSWETARAEIRAALSEGSKSLAQIAKEAAARHGLPRQTLYAEAVRIKAGPEEADTG
jgi:16S rRNA (cytidine1402-2'-O)-methyltransferase